MKTAAHPGYKRKRPIGDPIALPAGNPRFIPIPSQFQIPDGDLNMDLADVLGADQVKNIIDAEKMIFHCVGDTGPIKGDSAIKPLAAQMENEASESYFFYHLGDIVYYNGQSTMYDPQFYTYYDGYPGKIVAIPGNHDCSTVVDKGDPADPEPSMTGFMLNFCAPAQVYHDQSSHRKNMDQPWAYWTLNTPYATIIGLFSNYDGLLDPGNDVTQYEWLVQQLKKADVNKKLIITVHHPCFSLDAVEGGYPVILNDLDHAFVESKRYPDLVLSGHVHNYQRFTRTIPMEGGDKTIPYVIAGDGGYADTSATMHKLQKQADGAPYETDKIYNIDPSFLNNKTPIANFSLSLNNYNETEPGFLRITIDVKNNKSFAEYITCPLDGDEGDVTTYDTFSF